VSDQSDAGENAALRKCMEELQEMLEQATKGIAALATGSGSGRAGQSGVAVTTDSARGSGTKKSVFVTV